MVFSFSGLVPKQDCHRPFPQPKQSQYSYKADCHSVLLTKESTKDAAFEVDEDVWRCYKFTGKIVTSLMIKGWDLTSLNIREKVEVLVLEDESV